MFCIQFIGYCIQLLILSVPVTMSLEEKIYIWSLVLKKSFLVELLLLIFSYLGEKAFPRKIIMNFGQNNVFLSVSTPWKLEVPKTILYKCFEKSLAQLNFFIVLTQSYFWMIFYKQFFRTTSLKMYKEIALEGNRFMIMYFYTRTDIKLCIFLSTSFMSIVETRKCNTL